MNDKKLLSVGIDIGTTTTQVIVSELVVGSASEGGGKPMITNREILHRGAIHRTRLLDPETVDMDATVSIVREELADAGFAPSDINTGAVIVTGETARKDNAEPLIHRLAVENGTFVAATAGAALEAILAGRGAGVATRAARTGETIANVDIGGGTTNIAVFDPAGVHDTRCINVGGRLVEFNGQNTVTKLSAPARNLSEESDLAIRVNENYDSDDLQRLIDMMAESIVDAITGPPFNDQTHALAIGSLPIEPVRIDGVVFTGGVGQLVNTPAEEDAEFEYGDIGALLAADVRERTVDLDRVQPDEDLQATVIGVGTQTTRLSGRTTMIDESLLPLHNLPAVGIDDVGDVDRETLVDRLEEAISIAQERYGFDKTFVLSFVDIGPLTYQRIQDVTHAITIAYDNVAETEIPVIVLTRQNCAKALGQTLTNHLNDRQVITLDEVQADEGDYLDIGSPLANSDTVPVVVKTLAFGS